jgi:TRAP-type transport system periplasmic protein
MSKRWFSAAIALAAAVCLAAGANAQALDLKFGTTTPPGGTQEVSAQEFAKRVNAMVGAKAKVEVFHSGQLGSDREMLNKLKLGTLDMSQPSTAMSSVMPEFGLFDLPYLVKDRKHMACIAAKIVWPDLAPRLEPLGYKLIGVWENGFRQITNNVRPINSPDDLKGIKIRVPEGVWRVRMFQAYGANPTPMAFSELFVALRTGVMDAQENPYSNIAAGKFQEVQKYLTESNHVYTPSLPAASVRRFQSYPADVQKAVLEAGASVMGYAHDIGAKEDEEQKAKLLAAGMQFNVSNRDAFVKASAAIYETFEKEVPGGKALVDRALALANGC